MNDVSDIMRLAGAEDGAESFQVALEGAARPGSQLPTTRVRRALEERRGLGPMPYNPNADRIYFRKCVAVDALAEVSGVVCDLWKCLDRMRYGDDPEQGFGEAAGKILDGPLTDIEKMVKSAGYALDQCFDSRGEREYTPGGLVMSGMSRGNLDTLCLHLRGEVAEAMTILKIIAPGIDKATDRDLPEMDRDLWKKAWPMLQKIDGRVDVLTDAIDKLIERRMVVGPGMMGDAKMAIAREQLRHGEALAEGLRELPPETPDWGSGLSEGGGDFERLAVPSFGTMALIPKGTDSYEVRPLGAGKPGPHAYGVIKAGKLAKVTKGYEKLMAAVLKAAVAAAQEAATAQQHLDAIGEGVESSVGKAYRQTVKGDEYWFLGTAATKSNTLKGSLVQVLGGRASKAKQSSLPASYLGNDYKEVPLKDVPKAVAAQWKAAGALKEASNNLAARRGVNEARAVIVVKLTIPARKPSGAAESPGSWTTEEEKMASDFELALERGAIKSEKAPKAAVKVSKIGFEGTGSKYAMRVTVEVSGEGVSSADEDLITALDKRAEAALGNVAKHNEQAADAAFGDLDWAHSTIEVM